MQIFSSVVTVMLGIVTLTALLSAAASAPGVTHISSEELHQVQPIYSSALVPIAKQVVEPQDVTYTRTDVISRKITSSAPHPNASPLVPHLPHTIKNTYYTEENIVRGPPASVQVDGPEIEANFHKIEINVPQPPQVTFERQEQPPQPMARLQEAPVSEPPRPLHPHPQEIPAPILRPFPQPILPESSEPLEPINSQPKIIEPNILRSEPLIKSKPTEVITKTSTLARVPVIHAHLTPLAKIQTPAAVGYPISAAKLTDFRRTYFTPISTAVRSGLVVAGNPPLISSVTYDQPLITESEPCNDNPVKDLSLQTAVSHIHHGNGAVSKYYY